jgi:uncharacterized membrane protein YjfL (UPF0719 family)
MIEFNFSHFINAVVYAVLGVVIFLATFAVVDFLTPYKLWEEIVEHKNTALAMLVGAMSLGICLIIASAIH